MRLPEEEEETVEQTQLLLQEHCSGDIELLDKQDKTGTERQTKHSS